MFRKFPVYAMLAAMSLIPLCAAPVRGDTINNKSIEQYKSANTSGSTVITNKDIKAYANDKGSYPKGKPKTKKAEPKKTKSLKQSVADKAAKNKAKRQNREPYVKISDTDSSLSITIKGSAPEKGRIEDDGKLKLPPTLKIIDHPLPHEKWRDEYSEYFEAHYDDPSPELSAPSLITVRSLKAPSLSSLLTMYEMGSLYDEGDDGPMYGHLSSHFIIDTNGMIISSMPLNLKTRGCEGLEHKAITIELIGTSENEFNFNAAQKDSLTCLLTAICEKFGIDPEKIYSQSEAAKGKQAAPEYLDLNDSEYPDSYSPRKRFFSPSQKYMQEVKEMIKGKLTIKKEQKK